MCELPVVTRQRAWPRTVRYCWWLIACCAATCSFVPLRDLAADNTDTQLSPALREIYAGGVPQTVDDLRLMDAHQQLLVKRISPTVVGLQIGQTQGSGVLVSKDGYVLTASHVAGQPDLDTQILMSNGQKYRGKTLGMNRTLDAALVKIDPVVREGQEMEWPFAELGRSSNLRPGHWCLGMGHPGGFQAERPPVARFGRVLANNGQSITTDCLLVGGDSGGPLFDMEGNVIGIHSRIGTKLTKNLHVPVEAYRESWDRLARGDSWGSLLEVVGRPVIGVLGDRGTEDARIVEVLPGSPAERAGIRSGDLITRFGDEPVDSFDELKQLVSQSYPGDEVVLEVVREDQRLELKVVLAAVALDDSP